MFKIEVSLERITDSSSYPLWVEGVIYDIWEKKYTFIDKSTIFTEVAINPENFQSQKGFIRCEIIEEWVDGLGRSILTVSTKNPDNVETTDGKTEFDLLSNQVTFC